MASAIRYHTITEHLTRLLVGDTRPNCEANWAQRLPGPPIPWKQVWNSLGTPLSDPTEEKAWRKLLHRAINAKNRHPNDPDHSCRLLCGEKNESMLHMIECRHARPLWKACITFIHDVLGEECPRSVTRMVIFNTVDDSDRLYGETARALLRHAYGVYYAEVTRASVDRKVFNWQLCFYKALANLRLAALRWSHTIWRLHTHRRHTNLTDMVSEETRNRFSIIIVVNPDGSNALTSAFIDALDSARQAASTRTVNTT